MSAPVPLVLQQGTFGSFLVTRLAEYQDKAKGVLAANTERALRADTAVFTTWCGDHGLEALPASPDTVAAFIEAQAAEKPPPDSKVESGVVLVALSRVGSRAYLADLSSARLTLSRIAPVTLPGRGGEALHIGYRGTRGCQVSLLVVPGGA